MAQFDAQINLILNAQKALKAADKVAKDLDKKFSSLAKQVEKKGPLDKFIQQNDELVKQKNIQNDIVKSNKTQIEQTKKELNYNLRLAAALERQATIQKALERAGGGSTQEARDRIKEASRAANLDKKDLSLQQSVNVLLEKELQIRRELNRSEAAQQSIASKNKTGAEYDQRIARLRAIGVAQEKLAEIEKAQLNLGNLNMKKKTDLAKAQRAELERLINTQEKLNKISLSPGRQLASPIRGSTSIPGSPKFLAAQAKKVADEERKVNKLLADQQRLRDRNAKAAKRTADQVARKRQQELKTLQKNQAAGLVGAGFPLLFGGGPGSVLGGALGGALGGKEFGFELSVGLGALGSVIDRLIGSARNLGNAFSSVDETLKQVQQIGFNVNRATEKRVQLLVEEGRATEAFLLILERTGITAQQVQNLRELDTAFDELQDSFAKLFVTLASELTPAIVVISNLITEFVKGITGPEIQRAAANLDPQAFQAAQTEAAQQFGQRFGPAGDRQGYENFLTERAREIVAANSPVIDTSQLEKINTFTRENLDLIQKRAAALKAGNDLSKEEAYIAARQVVFAQTRKEVADAEGNSEKIKIALARESLSLDELKLQRQKDIEQLYKSQARELERILNLQRRITDAQISAQLAQDIFQAQPIPDPTPFSRATPEEKQRTDLELQRLKYTAEISKIYNQDLTILEREAKLKEAAAKNDLAVYQINKRTTEAVKQRTESQIELFEGLKLQLNQSNATTDRAKKLLQVEADIIKYRRDGLKLSKEQEDLYRRMSMEIFDNNNLTKFEQSISDLINTVAGALTTAMNTALVDTIAAAIQGADDLNDKLKATAATLLTQIGGALFQAGVGSIGTLGKSGSGSGLLGQIFNRDTGGSVTSRQPYIVGERGPELFIPRASGTVVNNADSRAALDRYTPNSSYNYSSNLSITTGPVMQMNNEDYIRREDFERGLRQATADGAKRGEAMTLKRLKNSRSTRSTLGM